MANQTNSGNRFDAFAKQVARRRFLRDAALLGVATPLAERLLAASGQVAAAATRAQAEPKGGSISIVMTATNQSCSMPRSIRSIRPRWSPVG